MTTEGSSNAVIAKSFGRGGPGGSYRAKFRFKPPMESLPAGCFSYSLSDRHLQ
jgi:hypothetical protein